MIWFNCSKCGKTHGRPENSIGSVVFCECGQGNRVPWESTAPEPPPQPVPAALPGLPASPTLAPLTFDSPPSAAGVPARMTICCRAVAAAASAAIRTSASITPRSCVPERARTAANRSAPIAW